MNEHAPQIEKLDLLREQVSDIDEQLKAQDLSDTLRNDLLDQREGVRLLMAADAMTRLENEALPPVIDEELALTYLRPSGRGNLKKRLIEVVELEKQGGHDPQKSELELIQSIIDRDAGPRQMVENYAKNSGEPAGETWIDTATGVCPRTE